MDTILFKFSILNFRPKRRSKRSYIMHKLCSKGLITSNTLVRRLVFCFLCVINLLFGVSYEVYVVIALKMNVGGAISTAMLI